MFKPGDRVKCVDASKTSLQEDRIYVVKACEKHGVLLEGISYCWYMTERFEYPAPLKARDVIYCAIVIGLTLLI